MVGVGKRERRERRWHADIGAGVPISREVESS
jgi:hypothetical protein